MHVNPENFEIIAKLRNESHLERLESLYQRTLKPKIINQCSSVPLITFSNYFKFYSHQKIFGSGHQKAPANTQSPIFPALRVGKF